MENKTLGRYKILRELGRGAMGAVYLAVDPLIEREVAIKTLLPSLPPEVMGEVRERFIREARSAGRLNHPNIVTIFDVGEENGVAYIAMELLDGRTLQQLLRDSGRPPFETTAEIIAQVAEALDTAQQFKIVHRDVKPANIMVNASGRVKLADFGVARVDSSSMTQTGAALGSPKYMSPEQVLGQPVDPRSDIFSLGVVLYEMLTGRTPFERPTDTTVFSLMNRIAGEPHPPARSVIATIPEAFDKVLDRALAKRTDQRYARAGDMAADLRRIYRGGAPMPAAEYEKTMVLPRGGAAAAPPPSASGLAAPDATKLINDLDQFSQNFENLEQQHLRQEEEERQRKEAEVQRWLAEQAKKREEYERARDAALKAGGVTPSAPPAASAAAETGGSTNTAIRRGALDFLKQKAATQGPREDPAAAKARIIEQLDKSLRAAYQYLAEVVREMNALTPTTSRPYEYIYLGVLPSVTLSEGFVDSRPLHIPGRDVLQHIAMRYRITPVQPAVFSLLGSDILRCIEFLKANRIEYKATPETRDDFGKVTKASFTVSASLPCQLVIRGDYEGNTPSATMELLNVRKVGRMEVKLPADLIENIVDDLARWILGVDDDLEKVLRKR